MSRDANSTADKARYFLVYMYVDPVCNDLSYV